MASEAKYGVLSSRSYVESSGRSPLSFGEVLTRELEALEMLWQMQQRTPRPFSSASFFGQSESEKAKGSSPLNEPTLGGRSLPTSLEGRMVSDFRNACIELVSSRTDGWTERSIE